MTTTNTLPNYGEIIYDKEGKPICHICGKSFKKLMSHVHQKHGLSAREYKIEFGLETTKSIMCKESIELARKRNLENYDKVVVQNLVSKGGETRFKKGNKGRTKDQVSEMTRQKLIKHIRQISIQCKEEEAYENRRVSV